MTRRIVLTLADSVLDYHCGKCAFVTSEHGVGASGEPFCSMFGMTWLTTNGGLPRRLDACLAAEAAASRLVEIAPEDADTLATIVDDWNRRCIPEADLPESIAKIRDALRSHAGEEFRG